MTNIKKYMIIFQDKSHDPIEFKLSENQDETFEILETIDNHPFHGAMNSLEGVQNVIRFSLKNDSIIIKKL